MYFIFLCVSLLSLSLAADKNACTVVSHLCVFGPALYYKLKKGFNLQGVSASCAPPQSILQLCPVTMNCISFSV